MATNDHNGHEIHELNKAHDMNRDHHAVVHQGLVEQGEVPVAARNMRDETDNERHLGLVPHQEALHVDHHAVVHLVLAYKEGYTLQLATGATRTTMRDTLAQLQIKTPHHTEYHSQSSPPRKSALNSKTEIDSGRKFSHDIKKVKSI